MKKKVLLAGMATVGACVIGLCACSASDNGKVLAKTEDVYGLGAVTSVRLLGSEISGAAVERLTAVSVLDERRPVATAARNAVTDDGRAAESGEESDSAQDVGTSDEKAKAQIEKFNEYFTALDCFLGEDVVNTTAIENPDVDGAYAEYAVKLTVTGRNMTGDDVTHTMYYTETLVKEKVRENETKSEYVLEGVMIVDGADYLLRGERSYEADEKETENELKIRAYSGEDEGTFVEMSQETSEEQSEVEKEYVYRVYVNGTLAEETAIEFENESKGDKQETEYELEFRQGEVRGKYKVEREVKDGETQMKVKYDIDGESGTFRLRKRTVDGEEIYEYTFSDNTKKAFKTGAEK